MSNEKHQTPISDLDGNRRSFLSRSLAASTGAILGFSYEEGNLLAKESEPPPANVLSSSDNAMPTGKIGNVTMTRLLIGGNLTSGIAHSRDLIYVSPLVKHYFTDEKIYETWGLAEAGGINTAILRLDEQVVRQINTYWKERGGKLQWIVQIKPKELEIENFRADIQWAIDSGATGAYIQGNVADRLVRDNRIDVLGEALQCIRKHNVIAGIGGHSLEVPVACEKAGLEPDFYLKTLHGRDYWSFNPGNEAWQKFHVSNGASHENVWCTEPEETISFMKNVKRPWIAFKVMAAGAIHPKQAFQYAYENGADFICAGMFDFQVQEDTAFAKDILAQRIERERPWFG